MLRTYPAVVFLLLLSAAPPTLAQGNDAGQIQKRIEEERPEAPVSEPPAQLETPEAAPQADGTDDVSFVLGAVVIQGSSVFEPEEFTPFYENLIARRISGDDVARLGSRITRFYRDNGYALSRAEVTPQDINAGVLVVNVVEGYVADVVINGEEIKSDRFLAYFDDVLAERPTRLRTIERAVYLINDRPGFSVADSDFSEGDDPGAYTLDITLERDQFDLLLSLDNRGTPEIGRLQNWTAAGVNDLLGFGERVQLGFFTNPVEPAELLYGEINWTQPVGASGLVFSLTGSATETDSGGGLSELDLESKSRALSATVTYPITRNAQHSVWIRGGFDILDIEEVQRGALNFKDRVRTVSTGATYLGNNLWSGDHNITLDVTRGLPILDASGTGDDLFSRGDAERDFTKIELSAARVQRFGTLFSLSLSGKGQWSADPLMSSEEFSLGGGAFGRGYDYSELAGEGGYGTSLEGRLDIGEYTGPIDQLQLYGFYDIGSAYNDDGEWQSLSSTGGGFRMLFESFYGDLQVAKPLTLQPSGRNDRGWQYHFSLSAGF